MSNIVKKYTDENMQTHNRTLQFIGKYLLKGYAGECHKRLLAKNLVYDVRAIRRVKNGETEDWKVMEVLAEIALENKTAKEKVAQLINNN